MKRKLHFILNILLVVAFLAAIAVMAVSANGGYSISGVVFHDKNKDGILNGDDEILYDSWVTIDGDYAPCDGTVDWTEWLWSAGDTGIFTFTGLPGGGCYSLHESYWLDNWKQTAPVTVNNLSADMTGVNIGTAPVVLTFTPATLPSGVLNQSYNLTVTFTGGVPPYSFETDPENPLPSGLVYDFDGTAGTITFSGAPIETGDFWFEGMIRWSDGESFYDLYQRQLYINPTAETITWIPATPAVGQPVTFTGPQELTFSWYSWGAYYDNNGDGTIVPGGEGCNHGVGTEPTLALTFPAVGDYIICLYAWDVVGPPIYYDQRWVTVAAAGQPPSQELTQIRDELAAMSLSNAGDRTKLQDAISHLNKALDGGKWLDDSHLKPGAKGEGVFNEMKNAIAQLKALRDGNKSGVQKAVFQDYIDRILAVARELAQTAIDDAAGGNPAKLKAAKAALLKGDTEASKDHPDRAIDQYKTAWKNAIAA
jgi:hypothetical protein